MQRSNHGRGSAWRRWAGALGFAVAGAWAAAAAAADAPDRTTEVRLVWPPAPAVARIAYERSITGPASVGVRASSLGRLGAWVSGAPATAPDLVKPFGLALDESDNVCITDPGAGAVCFYDQGRKHWDRWTQAGGRSWEAPVAVARRDGVFYVADAGWGRVVAFRQPERLLLSLTNGLTRPSGLALLGGHLYVADAAGHRIVAFDLAGQPWREFGRRGTGPGEFNYPTHLAATPDGRLLVTDSLNNRIEVFDAEGKFLQSWGEAGDTPGHFARPKGAAVDSLGHVYVLDALADNLQLFDATGQLLLVVGGNGAAPGQFWMPAGIAITRKNEIWVADACNHRLQVFQYLDAP